MTDARISRAVPLDQLREPETDVRERRPQDAVKSLAASMGDPDVGQLQDVLVHPVDPDDLEDDLDDDDLDELFRDEHPMRIVDGETRRMAAKHLGWATLDATIVPEPPEETVVAQLDANTERVEMSEFETVRALYEHYERTEATLDDIGDKVGFSSGYLSEVFSLFEGPECVVEAWQHPEHPLETGHARACMRMLSDSSVERYAAEGDLDDGQADERALEDVRLMVDVQAQHDLQVSDFRQRCKRCQKESYDQLSSDSTTTDPRGEGQARAAEREATGPEPEAPPECTCCGSARPNRRKYALEVCHECYGMLSSAEANDEVLMQNGGQLGGDGGSSGEPVEFRSQAHKTLHEFAQQLPEHEVSAINQELQGVQESTHEASHD